MSVFEKTAAKTGFWGFPKMTGDNLHGENGDMYKGYAQSIFYPHPGEAR